MWKKNFFKWNFFAFLDPKQKGLIFHFVLRKGFKSKKIMLTLKFWVPKMPING